jgi:hypothetical protein
MTCSALSAIWRQPQLFFYDPELIRIFYFAAMEMEMGSKTQKTEKIRYRKRTSNKINMKASQKQIGENLTTLVKLEKENLTQG